MAVTLYAEWCGAKMANPATKQEVENVLSSIRRLVGEVKREEVDDGPAEFEATDMLVLTPQFRVSGNGGVLRLMPKDAVDPEPRRFGFNETSAPFYVRPPELVPDPEPEQPEVALEPVTPSRTELSAKIAALETAIAKTVDDWEPDDTGRDPYAGTQPPPMVWRENVELDGRGAPLSLQGMAIEAVEEVVDDFAEEQVLDEETLRQMVSQIVRSELQGELGERITRNVRKLVRREIQRALADRSIR